MLLLGFQGLFSWKKCRFSLNLEICDFLKTFNLNLRFVWKRSSNLELMMKLKVLQNLIELISAKFKSIIAILFGL